MFGEGMGKWKNMMEKWTLKFLQVTIKVTVP